MAMDLCRLLARLGQQCFYDIGVPTEQDVIQIFGLSPVSLGLKPTTMQSPDLGSMTVYPMKLHGLSGGDLAAIHKLRFTHSAGVSFEEQYLSPATEMHGSQGDAWLSFAARRHVDNRALNLKSIGDLKSFSALRSVAQSQIARVQQASSVKYEGQGHVKREPEDAMVKDDASDSKQSGGEDDAYATPKGKQRRANTQPLILQPPTAERGMLATGKADIVKHRPGVGRGRGGRGRGAAQAALADAQAVEAEEALASMDVETFRKTDPDMFQVAEMHERHSGKSSVSFQNLDVVRFLQGEKLGQSLTGVAWLPCHLAPWFFLVQGLWGLLGGPCGLTAQDTFVVLVYSYSCVTSVVKCCP